MKNKPTPRVDPAGTHVQAPNSLTALKSKPALDAPAPAGDRPTAELPPSGAGFGAGWSRFWFTPADPSALHAVRVLAGLLFLFWLLPFAGNVEAFFSFRGLLDENGYREMSRELGRFQGQQRPFNFGWSLLYLVGDNVPLVQATYWAAIGVLILFTLGIAPRITAVLTYVLIVSFVSFLDAPLLRPSEDSLLVFLAFFLMIGYVLLGQFSRDLTPWQRIVGTWDTALAFLRKPAATVDKGNRSRPAGVPSSYAANLAMRLFQVNFALLLVVACLHKLQFGDWWSGVGFWFPLHPTFETKAADIHNAARHGTSLLFFYSTAQYLFLAWQLTFPVWAWRRGLFFRGLLVGGGILGFIGSVWIYQMPAAGAFYLVGCLAFLTADEWCRLGASLSKIWQKSETAETARAAESRTLVGVK